MRLAHAESLSLALILPACGVSSGHEAPAPQGHRPPPEVSVVTVRPHAVPVSCEYVGETAGSREVEVRARVSRILLARNFKEGAAVRAGQSLFTIDPAPFRVALLKTSLASKVKRHVTAPNARATKMPHAVFDSR